MEMNAIVAGLTSRFATAKKKLKRYVAKLSERPHMAKNDSEDYYDEPMTDQDPRESDDSSDKEESGYETFLAPKSAFAGKDIGVGDVHRVRIERVLDDELELRCLKPTDKEKSVSEPENDLYE